MKLQFKLTFIDVIVLLFTILFVYTAATKLMDYKTFLGQMYNQPFDNRLALPLSIVIPTLEILATILIGTKKWQRYGFILSTLLMGAFTIYVGLILGNKFDRIPCSCGGIMAELSWNAHLAVNGGYTLLGGIGWYLSNKQKKNREDPISLTYTHKDNSFVHEKG